MAVIACCPNSFPLLYAVEATFFTDPAAVPIAEPTLPAPDFILSQKPASNNLA